VRASGDANRRGCLKNLEFRQNWGDGRCPGDPGRSFVGHPHAILFLVRSRDQCLFRTPESGSSAVLRAQIPIRPATSGNVADCRLAGCGRRRGAIAGSLRWFWDKA
jgi:hypothetical protein